TKMRRHAFWAVGNFDGDEANAVEEPHFPLDDRTDRLIDVLQAKFAESPRASEALAWFIGERERTGADGRPTIGWTSLTESPSRRRGNKLTVHPKLSSLERWIERCYREHERRWLTRSTEHDYCFKILVYVHHVKTATELSPWRRLGDRPGIRIRQKLRDL